MKQDYFLSRLRGLGFGFFFFLLLYEDRGFIFLSHPALLTVLQCCFWMWPKNTDIWETLQSGGELYQLFGKVKAVFREAQTTSCKAVLDITRRGTLHLKYLKLQPLLFVHFQSHKINPTWGTTPSREHPYRQVSSDCLTGEGAGGIYWPGAKASETTGKASPADQPRVSLNGNTQRNLTQPSVTNLLCFSPCTHPPPCPGMVLRTPRPSPFSVSNDCGLVTDLMHLPTWTTFMSPHSSSLNFLSPLLVFSHLAPAFLPRLSYLLLFHLSHYY